MAEPLSLPLSYCADPYRYLRRKSRVVNVGHVAIGGDNPIRVQSMLTSNTLDTEACVAETLGLVEAGCEIVRVTAQTRRHAANLENIKSALLDRGIDVPLVADIHFKPDAAMEAAKWVEKVRVNPGNFVDSKKFAVREYSDEEYEEELGRIRDGFTPLVELCLERGVAMRIGTNHGSLSDRIMNRYGDTPLGMVESALEFARIARDLGYHNFLFSMKASNPKVMVEAYRLLVARLAEAGEDWNYPIHLGVTEAGDGEDGRIKSAIGIGSLLDDGVGDTIRVSLTEDAIHEIPVAFALAGIFNGRGGATSAAWVADAPALAYDPFDYAKRASEEIEVAGTKLGGEKTVAVFTSRAKYDKLAHKIDALGDFKPEVVVEDSGVIELDPRDAG
ncbi:MAG: (E)-4-hydroxy-3-methylbut-2-enyl-diphosphate synthase, partial [Verrucomicrobiales bacterium]